eukprot:TRINITY_DN72710_c0_g1_i1.p1 TRINITY_DN72710_c0_g1~~TRINITY_DN72710_c0_g1_i1.p1  ORF type:complete len:433 (-),score=55.55 TRINITY_DN72710_c0_g1_i1:245-1486(-)
MVIIRSGMLSLAAARRLPMSLGRHLVSSHLTYRAGARIRTRLGGTYFATVTSSKPTKSDAIKAFVTKHTDRIGLAGFGLLTIQWLMEDVLMLRCMGVLVASSMIIFNHFRTPPLTLPVRFNALFIAINVSFITRLLIERRDIELDEIENDLWESTFSGYMTKVQMRKFLQLGHRKEYNGGEIISRAKEGKSGRLVLLLKGEIVVKNESGDKIASVAPGNFVGEIQVFVHHSKTEVVTTSFSGPAVAYEWNTADLEEALRHRADVRHALEALFAKQLAAKLHCMNTSAPQKGFENILRGMFASGTIGDAELAYLTHYQTTHNISHDFLKNALEEIAGPTGQEQFQALVENARVEAYHNVLKGVLADGVVNEAELQYLQDFRDKNHIDDKLHRVALKRLHWSEQDFNALKSLKTR